MYSMLSVVHWDAWYAKQDWSDEEEITEEESNEEE